MRARVLLLCGLFAFALGAAPKPSATPKPQMLRAFVVLMLDQAPVDYRNMRGTRTGSKVYQLEYKTLPQFVATCHQCTITDEFAWTGHPENWSLRQQWYTHKMTRAQVQKYILAQLAPALKDYRLTKTGSAEYPTYVWNNGATGLWVSVDTYNGGFYARIGHNVEKPMHVLKSPSAADLAALRNAVTNFITLGVGPASGNFASLRGEGKKDIIGEMSYPLTVSFGSSLADCSVSDGSVNTIGIDDFSPKWLMSCQTVPMVATKEEIQPVLHDAMAAALPAGFSVTTGKYLGFDDYRWDNGSTEVAADIDSFAGIELPNGLVAFNVGIIHFLPKPAATSSP
ncbi:MAG TPA: hypothetical protein VMG98_08540 [Verrucomicrobiae bacterium]|nr:hypothetical protein [Verrucomicrobiae bacterium]